MEKKNRAFILQTVVSKDGSFNNDFNHSPKQYGDQFYASDRALKHAVRNLMEQMDEEVLIRKWIKSITPGEKEKDSSKMDTMNKAEVKNYIKEKKGKDISQVFWDFKDVRQFGVLYDNLAIHGVVQVSQGNDLYGKGIVYEDDLIGPMIHESKNKGKETRGMATREKLSEAHFAYGISVNPKNVHFLKGIEGFEDCVYTEEDYKLLIECLENAPREVKSTQKTNCFTGFLLEVELKDGLLNKIDDLQSKLIIEDEKEDGKIVYDVSRVYDYLEKVQNREGGSIYKEINLQYDEEEIELKGNTAFAELVK